MTFTICLSVIAVAIIGIAIEVFRRPEKEDEPVIVYGRQISDERKEMLINKMRLAGVWPYQD